MIPNGLHLTPFRGLRYSRERVRSLAAVTSPPYDVVVRPDGLHRLEDAEPHNIVRLILPHDATSADRHRKAARVLHRWQAQGVLSIDPQPALYVYEQRRGGELQRGLIGALRLTPPGEGVVLPHEDVMPEVVEDRAALLRETATNLEPLLFAYRGGRTATGPAAVIERAVRHPPLLVTTTDDGFAHRLWSVTDPGEQDQAGAGLAGHRALIGDGHHRWAACLRLQAEQGSTRGPWAYGLVLLVDTDRYPLRVQAIHRVLHRLPPAAAVSALRTFARCRPVDGPLEQALDALTGARGNAFLLAGDGAFRLVDRIDAELLSRTVRGDRPRLWRALDATVLHSTLLATVWQVPDTQEDIGYLHDPEAAVAQAGRQGGTAVLMRPVGEEIVRQLAEQGVTMPRKSTSFGPKPASGLVLRSLDEDG